MFEKLKQFVGHHWGVLIACAVFVALTGPFFTVPAHLAANLEPYPDGLLYTVPAWNFVQSGQFSLILGENSLQSWVASLYSWLLVPVYLIFRSPVFFYGLNVLLGLGGIFFLYRALRTVASAFVAQTSIILYAVMPALVWLPSVPMAENLSLFLINALLFVFVQKEMPARKKGVWLIALQLALLFTKFSSYSFLIPLNFLLTWDFIQRQKRRELGEYILLGGLAAGFYFVYTDPQLIFRAFQPAAETKTNSSLTFFSAHYFVPHFWFYVSALIGKNMQLLWEKLAILPLGFAGIALVSFFAVKKKEKKLLAEAGLRYGFLICGIIISLAFFYSADARYALGIIPCVFLLTATSLLFLFGKNHKAIALVIFLFLALLIVSERNFYKQIIATNWLNRARAWQYEAVRELSAPNFPPDSVLITALPPYLFSVYAAEHPRLAPLSEVQEFMNENQRPWGDDVEYAKLLHTYSSWLEEGRPLFITNAYITHQQAVIDDYEAYKQEFGFTLVTEGCDQACNLYQLTLKE